MSLMDAPYVWETAPKSTALVGGGERERAFPHGKLQTQNTAAANSKSLLQQPGIISFLPCLSPGVHVSSNECFHCVTSCPGHPGTASTVPSRRCHHLTAPWPFPSSGRPFAAFSLGFLGGFQLPWVPGAPAGPDWQGWRGWLWHQGTVPALPHSQGCVPAPNTASARQEIWPQRSDELRIFSFWPGPQV